MDTPNTINIFIKHFNIQHSSITVLRHCNNNYYKWNGEIHIHDPACSNRDARNSTIYLNKERLKVADTGNDSELRTCKTSFNDVKVVFAITTAAISFSFRK